MTGHDAAFAEHRARRQAERAEQVRVTWRRVSPDTGGGWSGLGPNGLLVYVKAAPTYGRGFQEYGRVIGSERLRGGYRSRLVDAKRAAENVIQRIIDEAPAGAERSTMTTATIPTAESLIEGIGEATAPTKAPYVRLRAAGRTLAYCSTRKDGVMLDFATSTVEGAPARLKKSLEAHGGRTALRVTAKNEKEARDLLEWLAGGQG